MNLVTGATGHIGNVLVRMLREQGQPVRALALPGEDIIPLEGLGTEIVEANVLDPERLAQACQGVDTVYHLAGVISILPGKNNLVRQVNVEGTRNILRACSQTGVRRLVYTSSIHALSRAVDDRQIDESVPFDPHHAISAYDNSKAQASLDVLAAAEAGLDAVVACPTGVIGPWDYRLSELGSIIQSCVKGEMQLYVDGAYDFVDVRDVAAGLLAASEKGRKGETYIFSGEQLSVPRLLQHLHELTGKRFNRMRMPLSLAQLAAHFTPFYYRMRRVRPRFTPYSLATLSSNSNISHAKASRDLGYAPRPLRQTLADTVAWFEERIKTNLHSSA